MATTVHFRAPWGALLTATSLASAALLAGLAILCHSTLPPTLEFARFAAGVLPLLVVLGCVPFMVRGYVLTERELIIQRLGWTNRWPLAGLTLAEVDPDALKKSLRLWGNGGLFSFSGWFRSKKLGLYRLFGTDPKRSVVLRFAGRTIVVTPDQPGEFVAEIRRRAPALTAPPVICE